MEFENKTILISGGASGLGFLCGQCFAKEGAAVVLADINKEALDEKVGEIRADGGKAEAAVVDVRNYEQVCAARDLAVEKFGSLDVVVNCAGGAEVRMCNAYHYGEFKDIPMFMIGE